MRLPKANLTAMCAVVALVVGSSDPSYGQCEGGLPDCNNNGIADECDIADGTSGDCNHDGRPDECGVVHGCELAKLAASDATAGVSFGESVSVSEDVILIGAYWKDCPDGGNCGSAYFYRRQGEGGSWVEEQEIIGSDTERIDGFGISVAIDGNLAVVGASEKDCPAGTSCGAAYVFRWDGSSWVQEQKLLGSEPFHFEFFGIGVSLGSDVLVVKALLGQQAVCGDAYVFRFNGNQWVEESMLRPSGQFPLEPEDFCGGLAASKNVVVVGSNSLFGFSQAMGSAYVFRRVDGNWVEWQRLTGSDAAAGDRFGNSVATSGDVILVGASGVDCRNGVNCGAAYVFRFNGIEWIEEGKLTPSDAAQGDGFGASVSIADDIAVAVAVGDDCADGTQCGSAYVFRHTPAGWAQVQKLERGDERHSQGFLPVAFDGNTTVVGANGDPCASGGGCGAAYVFAVRGSDCNCSRTVDICDITTGASLDTDEDGIPDDCVDCNQNGVDDAEDIANGTSTDCDENGRPDECDLDCDHDSVPDFCEIRDCADGTVGCRDCNGNLLPDECDITDAVSLDCQANGIPDECEADCNENGLPDSCDLNVGTSADCNANEIPDACDIADGTSVDENANGIPDECPCDAPETSPFEPGGVPKNRAISFRLPSEALASAGTVWAIQVTLDTMYLTRGSAVFGETVPECYFPRSSLPDLSAFEGEVRWVGPPREFKEDTLPPGPPFLAAQLQCCPYFADWVSELGDRVLHVYGAEVVPCSRYRVKFLDLSCPFTTAKWGDIWAPFGQVNFTDIGKMVAKFKGIPHDPGPSESGAPPKVRAMLRGNVPPLDSAINFTDIGKTVEAFRALPYSEPGPSPCDPCP